MSPLAASNFDSEQNYIYFYCIFLDIIVIEIQNTFSNFCGYVFSTPYLFISVPGSVSTMVAVGASEGDLI